MLSKKLQISRMYDPGYIEEFDSSLPFLPPPSPPALLTSLPPPSQQQNETPVLSHHSKSCSTEVKLRIKNRRGDPASRPHSWHSTKLVAGQQESHQGGTNVMSSAWHHSYHTSASTTDLSGEFESGGSYLRKSLDQYSSRGSMESLDHPQSSQLHPGAEHHPFSHHTQSGPYTVYSSCQQLSSARSSNSIDHLHSKRDSAYSSFSTSSSIPEYLASTPSFSPERSYSLETVPQRGGGSGEMQQDDMPYIHMFHNAQQDLSLQQELSSTSVSLPRNSNSMGRGGVRGDKHHDLQGSVGTVCYRGGTSSSNGILASNRHSVGPIWAPSSSNSSNESLKGAPAPPRRSDSYAAIKNHERPNSWSTLEHFRSLRSLQKGSWHHLSGPVTSGTAKGLFSTEGQLHTVIEKSPESSPTIKPRQGGGFPPPNSPLGPSSGPTCPLLQSAHLILPTGVYSMPKPEPHYTQMPSSSPVPSSSGVYPSQPKDSGQQQCELQGVRQQDEESSDGWRDRRMSGTENGYQMCTSSSPYPYISSSTLPSTQLRMQTHEASSHPEPMTSSKVAQGQVPAPHSPVHLQPQLQLSSTHQQLRHHNNDLAALQHHHWDLREHRDREHPLTRLEIALAEVQGGTSPHSGNNSFSEGSEGPRLSVLEKVSKFERQECAGKQRTHSTSFKHTKATHQRMTEKVCSTTCGSEDLRHMLERSSSGNKACRTLSCRGGSSDMKFRNTADPSLALQRSRSSFHLGKSKEGDNTKSYPWRQDIQEILGPLQDTSFNRSHKDSMKDTQSKALQSTSFRQRDTPLSITPQLPSTSSPINSASPCGHQPPPVPVKHHSMEKKGPKTMPKPQGIIITQQSLPQVTSPHTLKEWHVVGPEFRGPALPSIPPVGPPVLMRICGRKRLTADQKKRSYSEPENINEVGVLDAETTALFKLGGETSVAFRRKMFELGATQNAISRPDLRQLQQHALAEYMERKKSVKRDEGGQRSGPRPHSAYLQSENTDHTDTLSPSSTSSLLSFQDSGPDRSLSVGERHHSTTLLAGANQQNTQSNPFKPGRVTSPRPPANPSPSTKLSELFQDPVSGTHSLQDLTCEAGLSRQSPFSSRDSNLGYQKGAAGPQLSPRASKQLNGALWSAGSTLSAVKSASAEDLLERSEESPSSPQHNRSRSTPTIETLNQDFPPGDVQMFSVFISETGQRSVAEDSTVDIQLSEGLVYPQQSQRSPDTTQPAGPSPDPASPHTAVTHRDRLRHRNTERQRVHSTSTLAASVGLPCPLSPPATQGRSGAKWYTRERLSQANLEEIIFPKNIAMSYVDNTTAVDNWGTDRQMKYSLSDACVPEDPTKDIHKVRAFTLEMRGEHFKENLKKCPSPDKNDTASPPPFSNQSIQQHLSSLPVTESSLLASINLKEPPETSTGQLQVDFDEVILQNPVPQSPAPPLKETNTMEDFPPLPPLSLLELDLDVEQQTMASPGTRELEDTLGLMYQPPPKRERTAEELRVEALVQQLVLRDPSLAPLLDTWGGKSTIKLLEEIFSNRGLGGKMQWQHRSSTRLDDRIQDGVYDPAQATSMEQGTEIDLDGDEKDLDCRKVELCEALRCCVVALRQEKEKLCEEQRQHQALGASIDLQVQELCKSNEKEKYSMLIGDLEKIVNLLLSLCSRLLRIDRSLLALQREELTQEDIAKERESLHHKRSQLLSQTEDAWELKENLDRRQHVVHVILSGYLTEPQLQNYSHFVRTKPSLLIRQRNLDDLIRQGEEQLVWLIESLSPEVVAALGWSRGSLLSFSSPCSSASPPLRPSTLFLGPPHLVRSTTVTSL
ncbi:protein Shroom3 [Aulostomus maculatus]